MQSTSHPNPSQTIKHRPIHQIAEDILRHWPKPYFGARPHVKAMLCLTTLDDTFFQDSARSIILHFLSNASTFRGEDARHIKAELKAMLK